MFANKYVKVLKPYPLVSHRAWELQGKEDVLKLDWNEATQPPSPKVKENILKFLENGNMHWYPDVNNSLLLEELSNYNSLPIENLQYFASSDSLHEYIVRTFIEPEDRIVIVTSRSALLASFKFNSKLLNLSGAFDLITLAWLAFTNRKLGVVTYTVPPLFSTCSELASSFNSTYKILSRTSVWI
jgi:hypothetical protein